MKIYHNPRCSKSRQTLGILEESKFDFEIVKYLDTPVTRTEIVELLDMLNMKPLELVRKNEAIWKTEYKGKELSDSDIIEALLKNPKLIERPIVVHNNKAVIGIPPELVKSLF